MARYEEAVLDTFDMLSPAYDSPMTAGEVRDVFRRQGVGEFTFLTTVPISVVGSVSGVTESADRMAVAGHD